jgi:hypothetical protein
MKTPSTELRTGNLVNLCFEHKPGWFVPCVTDIFKDGTIETDTQQLTGKQKYFFEGIPLTEEWLIKLGFQYDNGRSDGYMSFDFNGKLDIDWIDNKIQVKSHYEERTMYRILPIYFVHQIQNLYHILQGEELTIKQ